MVTRRSARSSQDPNGEATATDAQQPTSPSALLTERRRRGWSKARLIHALRQTAADQGRELPADASISRRIAAWENGHNQPDEAYTSLLARTYGKTPAQLGLPDPADHTTPPPGAGYPQAPDEALTTVTRLWRADLDQDQPLRSAAPEPAAWNEASLQWLTAPDPAPLPEHPTGIRVGLGDVRAIKTTTDMFVQLDDTFGGGHARPALIQYLTSDVAQLLTGRYTEAVGRALFSTVAEATLLAAWMSYDTGHHGIAQRYFLHALRLAQDGEDRRLAGSILSAMSHQATYLGKFREAATLARAARMGITPVATPTLLAQFHAMEARALAGAGDATACERALAQAARHLEAQRLNDEPEWITYFDDTELAAEAGHCFRDLTRAKLAVAQAQTATSGHIRSDFFATMVLADAHLAAGDLEEACRVAQDALDLGEQLKSARAVTYLADFRRHLARYADTATVRDFHEQAADHRLWARTT